MRERERERERERTTSKYKKRKTEQQQQEEKEKHDTSDKLVAITSYMCDRTVCKLCAGQIYTPPVCGWIRPMVVTSVHKRQPCKACCYTARMKPISVQIGRRAQV